MHRKSFVADTALLLVTLVWGTTFLIVQNAIEILPPLAFNGVRFTSAALLFAMIVPFVHRDWRTFITPRLLRHGIVLGILLFGGYGFQTYGLLYTTSSNAGFITGLSVVLVPFFAVILLRHRLSWTAWLSAVLALIGLFLLSNGLSTNLHINTGDILVLFGAICFALQIIATSRFTAHHPSLILVAIQLGTVGMLGLGASIMFEHVGAWSDWMQRIASTEVWTALMITMLLGTSFAFWAQTYYQKYTSPARVAIIFAMEPVFAGFTGYFFGQEKLGSAAVIGSILMLISMLVVELKASEGSTK